MTLVGKYASAILLAVFVAGVGSSLGALAQSDLPPEVQADILMKAIINDLSPQHLDLQKALDDISAYKKLKVEFPVPLLLTEAKALIFSLRAIINDLKVDDLHIDDYLRNSRGRFKVASSPVSALRIAPPSNTGHHGGQRLSTEAASHLCKSQ